MEEQDKNFILGKSDWNSIREVKEIVSIPVIANGDIVDEKSALECFEETKCDGLMIGRASLGNPWIFDRIMHYLKTGEIKNQEDNQEKIEVLKEHFELLLEEKGEYTATREIRKFIAWYVKGMPNSKKIKEKMNMIDSKQAFYDIF